MMNAKPILFSDYMIRAILDDRKTQTRRVMSKSDSAFLDWCAGHADGTPGNSEDLGLRLEPSGVRVWCAVYPEVGSDVIKYRYGQPGDLLWVRENWRPYAWHEGDPVDIEFTDGTVRTCECRLEDEARNIDWEVSIWESATAECQKAGLELNDEEVYSWEPGESPLKWRPSIHLPRWGSRITLKITDVRVQRIQEISDADALSEGIAAKGFEPAHKYKFCLFHSQELFVDLWDSINSKRGFGWHTNPWVWALTFEVIRENVDAVLSKAA